MLMSSVDANIMFAPPLLPPLTEVNLTGEGNATPALRSRSDANVTFAPHPYPPHPNPVLDLLHAHGDSTKRLAAKQSRSVRYPD